MASRGISRGGRRVDTKAEKDNGRLAIGRRRFRFQKGEVLMYTEPLLPMP